MYELICNIDETLCTVLYDAHKFPSGQKLLNKYSGRKSKWLEFGEFTREIYEVVNELVIAYKILTRYDNKCIQLEYEPPLQSCEQTIEIGRAHV